METGLLFLEDRMRCALLGMSGRRSLQLCVLEGAVCAVGWQKGERVRLGMAEREKGAPWDGRKGECVPWDGRKGECAPWDGRKGDV